MTTVERISLLIDKKGIEQKQFAKDIGIRQASVSEWKSGLSKSYLKHIDKIATYFNVTTDYLLGNTDSPDNTFVYDEDDNLVVIDDDTRELIDSLRTRPEMKILFSVSRKATKEDIEQAVKIIEALRKNENEE